MRELRSCDFCGADAVGVFEVLPPELTPADDQRRVVLCDHCRETLMDVTAPLLSRLGVGTDDAPRESGPSMTTSGAESVGDAVSEDVEAMPAEPTPPEPADHDSPDDPLDNEADPLGDGAEHDSPGDGAEHDSPDDEAGQAGDGDGDGGEKGAEAETAETETTETSDSATANDEDTADTPSEPPQFRKVVRILQNREFPVERADVEELASNAYDLDDEQVADIFDYAVERGLLVDDGGTLRKP